MGLKYDDYIEQQMTQIVKQAINGAKGRPNLAIKLGMDRAIIDDIADGRDYPLSIPTFEKIFGRKLETVSERDKRLKAETKTENKHDYREIDLEIRCPGFEEMKALLEKMGKRVRIVYDAG